MADSETNCRRRAREAKFGILRIFDVTRLTNSPLRLAKRCSTLCPPSPRAWKPDYVEDHAKIGAKGGESEADSYFYNGET